MPDWNAIKTEYIMTGASYRSLAKKYHADRRTIAKHALEDNWAELRAANNKSVINDAVKRLAKEETGRLTKLVEATAKAIDVAAVALDDEKQFNRYLVTEDFETKEKVFEKVDTRSLRDLTVVLKDLTNLMRDFYDLPTPAQRDARRISQERLELERGKNGNGEAKELTVRFVDTEGGEK